MASIFDGVLADFTKAFQQLTIEVTGRNLYLPTDAKDPPRWAWSEYRGYTAEEMGKVWDVIKTSDDFHLSLAEEPGCSTLRMLLPDLSRYHDIYFITSRPGDSAKWQTEMWLQLHLGIVLPTVLISSTKGLSCKALKLDVYIDDNYDYVLDVARESPSTRCYLLDGLHEFWCAVLTEDGDPPDDQTNETKLERSDTTPSSGEPSAEKTRGTPD